MKKPSLLPAAAVLLACLAVPAVHAAAPPKPGQPKLVVVLVVDGLPNEQVQRYRHQFGEGGFKRLLEQGAWFGNAHQAHGITVTAVGHSAVLTGAYPYQHGIIGNSWIDPVTHEWVYCTEDRAHSYIGETTKPDDGTSPRNLRVGTLGDELRYATGNQAKVITVAGKDRGAILLGGKTGTAYMYMETSGNFASSTYYMQQHPQWVQRYNATRPADKYYGSQWTPLLPEAAYAGDAPAAPATKAWLGSSLPITYTSASGKLDADYFLRLKYGPHLDQMTLEFAKTAVVEENLGRNPAGVPDLLGVSFSAHDYVNHEFGPESKMSHDHLQRLDRMLADLFGFLDKRVGMDNVVVVLTADHGFANTPEFNKARGIDAGRLAEKPVLAALEKHLAEKFSIDKLLFKSSLPHIALDYERASRAGVRRQDLEDTAARFLLQQQGVAQVFTRSQLEGGGLDDTRMGKLIRRAWNRQLAGDLIVIVKPNWYFSSGAAGTSHGTPYAYDSNVPLLIMGKPWFKPGQYGHYAEVVDIVPTLSHVLRLRPPPGAEGRVLVETLR